MLMWKVILMLIVFVCLQEEELSKHATPVFANSYGHGVLDRRPEDSVYWHPTLNPEGLPPAGKPQRYKTGAALALPQVRVESP